MCVEANPLNYSCTSPQVVSINILQWRRQQTADKRAGLEGRRLDQSRAGQLAAHLKASGVPLDLFLRR